MEKTLIIAEAGVNHNGSLEIAKRLIDVAAEAGADIVKFQTAKVDSLVSKLAPMAEYQKANIGKEESQKEMLEKLLLSYEDFEKLASYCNRKKIRFLSTPFDLPSIEFLQKLNNGIWKIPSGEITNLPYLEKIGSLGQEIILSTGMATMEEVEAAISVLKESGTKRENMTLLHCTSEYPAPYEEVNLRAMLKIQEKLGVSVGYSDHTKGIEIPIAAVALGAKVIEKHFTLDREMKGPDHKASLEPDELKEMIISIRHLEVALGDGNKKPSKSELKNRTIARKSIVAACNIAKGEILTKENLTIKRPGSGMNPMFWHKVLGKQASRDYREDELLDEVLI